MAVEIQRIVEVGFPDGGQGSGFLVSPRHVFTASHLSHAATQVGMQCRIRRLAPPPARKPGRAPPAPASLDGTVAWVDPGRDITVIRLDQPLQQAMPPLVCVRVNDIEPLDCFFTGFPQAAGRESRTVSGTLTLEPVGSRFDLDYHSASPLDERHWGGVSGAMVFHGDHAAGVVRTVSLAWNKKFAATPLALVLDDPQFQRYWQGAGEAPIAVRDAQQPARSRAAGRDMTSLLDWCNCTREYRTLLALTAPLEAGAERPAGVRLFGLAGHHDHRAIRIMPRLVEELRELGRNVRHIPINQHTDFEKVSDLDAEVMKSLFKYDARGARDAVEAMANSALAERWDACVISFPVGCTALGRRDMQGRLTVAADWLRRLHDFPCPVVVGLVLRWDTPQAGLFARMLGRAAPERQVADAWRALAHLHARIGGADDGSLCLLEGYVSEDLHCWIERDNVKPNLADCAHRISRQIDGWFRERPRRNFVELDNFLSNI